MSSHKTFQVSPFRTYKEETAGELVNKHWYFVQRGTTPKTATLVTTGRPLGVVYSQDPHTLEDHEGNARIGSNTVLLLGGNPVVKAKTSGAIAYGDPVKVASGGTVVVAASGDDAVGIYDGPDAASGDVIELLVDLHTVA